MYKMQNNFKKKKILLTYWGKMDYPFRYYFLNHKLCHVCVSIQYFTGAFFPMLGLRIQINMMLEDVIENH